MNKETCKHFDVILFAGNTEMTTMVQRHFNLPTNSDALTVYKDTLYLTQVRL